MSANVKTILIALVAACAVIFLYNQGQLMFLAPSKKAAA